MIILKLKEKKRKATKKNKTTNTLFYEMRNKI